MELSATVVGTNNYLFFKLMLANVGKQRVRKLVIK